MKNGWSSRALEREIKKEIINSNLKSALPQKDKDILRLERNLSSHLGYPTKIEYDNKGYGHLNIEFTSFEQLEGILERVGYCKDD